VPDFRMVSRALILSAVYVVIARLGLMLDAVGGFATLVWAPTGVSLVAVLLVGYPVAPGVFLGALVVNLWTGASVSVALPVALGNTLEAVLGAYALRRLAGFRRDFDRLRHVMALIVPVAMGTTLVSATIGVTSLAAGGIVSSHQFPGTWRAWWVGDMLGDIVVAPLLLSGASVGGIKVKATGLVEAVALGGLLVLASIAVFFKAFGAAAYPFESPYVLFPLFVWAAVRFGLRGAAITTAVASGIAIWGTIRGFGPFARPGEALAGSLLALQTFMGCAALTPLVVAGAISDRTRAIHAREQLVATVSHDLKNPLGAIRMSADALLRSLPEVSASRVERHVQLVGRSVERMTRFIGDLLDTSAIDAGRMAMDIHPEGAWALVMDAVDSFRPVTASKKQSLQVEGNDRLQVMCDRTRVVQVLANLIGNAIKFTGEGGRIAVRVERVRDAVRFSVEDTGTGIDPRHLRHVFERYWHADGAMGGGTGLGLDIAKGIVEAHGGKVWADSKVGIGSQFHFTLPAGGEQARAR
jgi:signal transduction histidine kinase